MLTESGRGELVCASSVRVTQVNMFAMFGIEYLDSFEPRFLYGLADVNLSSVVVGMIRSVITIL